MSSQSLKLCAHLLDLQRFEFPPLLGLCQSATKTLKRSAMSKKRPIPSRCKAKTFSKRIS
jgi:hypothetical protein